MSSLDKTIPEGLLGLDTIIKLTSSALPFLISLPISTFPALLMSIFISFPSCSEV
ncbi:hypothetical protein D3C76_1163430 [compost metagenome]